MGLPFKPGDWVADAADNIARVKSLFEESPGVLLLNLVMYSREGKHLGRTSPALGGPRGFEPACASEDWRRIPKPLFPLPLRWIEENGKYVARYWPGDTLPPADWTPKPRRAAFVMPRDEGFRKTLEQIADGHNDARQLAKDALAGRRH